LVALNSPFQKDHSTCSHVIANMKCSHENEEIEITSK